MTIEERIRKQIHRKLILDKEKKEIQVVDRYVNHVIAKGAEHGFYFSTASLKKYIKGTVAPNGVSLLKLAYVLNFEINDIVSNIINDNDE